MAINLRDLLEANRILLTELDQRDAGVDEREAKARAIIDGCEAERREIDLDRQALLTTERLYRRRFVPLDEDAPAPIRAADGVMELLTRQKPRARIGPQRYRVLAILRLKNVAIAPEEISATTNLTLKRVKDQLRADMAERIIGATGDGRYGLWPAGLDLLERFEHYKRSRGEPLPSITGPINDEAEEAESEQQSEQGAIAA